MQILFLSRWFPFPYDNGSKLRVYNLLRGLAPHHDITLLSFTEDNYQTSYPEELRSICRKIRMVPLRPFRPRGLRARAGFFSPLPRSVVDTYSAEMEKNILHELSHSKFDLVIASQVDTAVYVHCFKDLPALFEEVEVTVLYERYAGAADLRSRFRNYLTWFKQRHYLKSIMRFFNACTVVSEPERKLLLKAVPNIPSVETVPNCIRLEDYASNKTKPRPNSLIFAGSFTYTPNYEGMVWFLRDVYPLLERLIPDIQIVVTGNHADLPLPPVENLERTGWVPDIHPLIQSSRASIVPIHTGGGTRLKILESMALGTPVIATSKGAEGLDVESGVHILIADNPSDFAGSLHAILTNPDLRDRISKNALELVRHKYEWSIVMPRFLNLLQRIT